MPSLECSLLVAWRTGRSSKLLLLITAQHASIPPASHAHFYNACRLTARPGFFSFQADSVHLCWTLQGLWDMGKVSSANYRTT